MDQTASALFPTRFIMQPSGKLHTLQENTLTDILTKAIISTTSIWNFFAEFLDSPSVIVLCQLNRTWTTKNRSSSLVVHALLRTQPFTSTEYNKLKRGFPTEALYSLPIYNYTSMYGKNNESLQELAKLPHLLKFQTAHAPLNHKEMVQLQLFLNLKVLRFASAFMSDVGFSCLSSLTHLEHLYCFNCAEVTDNGLFYLSSLTALQSLVLKNFRIDAGLSHLKSLTALQCLDLESCIQLSNKGLSHLGNLSALQNLNLEYCINVTDDGLSHLSSLTALEHLNLSDCEQVTNKGLFHLSSLTALKSLDLNRCPQINDAGRSHFLSLHPHLHIT